MLGKYEFLDSEINYVLKYFEPTVSSIFIWIDYINEAFFDNNLIIKKLKQVKKQLMNMNYLDEFQDIKNHFLNIYDEVLYLMISYELKEIDYNYYAIAPKLRVIKELFIQADNIVKFCYDGLKKYKKVPSIKQLKNFFLQELQNKLTLVERFNKFSTIEFDNQQNEIIILLKNEQNIDKWLSGISLILAIYEDILDNLYNIDKTELSYFWKIIYRLNEMQSICEIYQNICYYINDK
ncbi:hypothetical protein SGLAD_v1c04650 [Spiroplasma gladiatoris]|uniref:Uncharacterized protein n=1 Tax=Spiroplasma gladiatoris TaxID=2143 RepID=A0A4P7AGW5_9MOLU|nr:hypothetical protein [Spiroplasma gladiatoris]QBQ07664.1 hypothetical protein SGLAD_v1c04650 [Spiroplasma gladiatoris]